MRSRRRKHGEGQSDGAWLLGLEALVADVSDLEGMHRIRVTIPSIDEAAVHDEWIPAMTTWVGPAGYGPVNLPELMSEVLLFGRLGQKHSLFYLSRYGEDTTIPGEFVGDNARGLKTDGRYKLLADLLIEIVSQAQVDVKAPIVRLIAGDSEVVRAESDRIGFLGASPATRQTLPPDATDLPSCIALCNALKHLVAIQFGFAE
jgi:hypothetical protein